jgi:lipoprotein NlpI
MANRVLTVMLVLAAWSISATPANAQERYRPRPPFGDDMENPRFPRGMNPEHEKTKTEADKANQSGDFQKAIDLTDMVLRQNPRDAVAYYLRAGAKVELGIRQGNAKLIREGVADSREAIRYDSKHTTMYFLPYLHGMKNLGVLENRRDHAETSIAIANQVLSVPGISNEDKANLLFQRSQAQAWLGKTDDAIADCNEALKLVPMHFGARAALADILSAAGKPEEALGAFNKLVESFPDSPLVYNNRGMFYQRQQKLDEAVADFTRAIERDPNYFYSYTNRGFTLLEMDNPVAAETDFSQSLKINPQQPNVVNLRGLAKLSRGDMAGAFEDERMILQMNPNDPAAHGDLGFLYVFSGDYASAVQEFDAALAIDPQLRHFSTWRIIALQRLGRTADLKQTYAASLAKPVKQREWIDNLVAYLLGAETDAELLAAASSAKDPLKTDQLCEANYFIGQAKAAAGKTSEATAAFQKAVSTKSRHLSAYRGSRFALRTLNPETGKVGESAAVVPAARSAATSPVTK